jgi:coenzyme F420 hydrogenase subunit beta
MTTSYDETPRVVTAERKHWKHLFEEIVATEICCACSACVVACPHKVLELHDFDPVQIDLESPLDDCLHGQNGCSLCAMACPRLDPDVDVIEGLVSGRRRRDDEPEGPYLSKTLARAADPEILGKGQDGGAVTAMIAWGLDTGELDGAVVAAPSETVPWLDEPRIVTTRPELLAAAGSRYTYCATPLALRKVVERKLKSIALVGVSCESTAVRQLEAAKIKRWVRPIKMVFGLMCCETFDYESYMVGKIQNERGIPLDDITKVNIKGRVIVSLKDGTDVTIPLKESRPYANAWCHHCPDFAAEHADLSCGGLGMEGWTMILVRTERGRDYLERAVAEGILELEETHTQPKADDLLLRLARKQRQRVKPDEPHALAAYASREALAAARAEEDATAANL